MKARLGRVLLLVIGMVGCQADEKRVASETLDTDCSADSTSAVADTVITRSDQLAVYHAVLDSLGNLYGKTALYLDPRIETVGQGKSFTRLHDQPVIDQFLADERFGGLCLVDDDSRCQVDSMGVSARFSAILRHTGGEGVLVDMTQQTVRPVSDSADWYFWAAWSRFWLEREGSCWRVSRVESKGTV